MAGLKTTPTKKSVTAFIDDLGDPKRRRECRTIMKIMRDVTGARAKMWGPSIVGYGSYHYRYASGREGDWFLTGFSPRKRDLTVYIMAGFGRYGALMKKLGKHKTGSSCLYIKTLEDVDLDVLRTLVTESVAHVRKTNPG